MGKKILLLEETVCDRSKTANEPKILNKNKIWLQNWGVDILFEFNQCQFLRGF